MLPLLIILVVGAVAWRVIARGEPFLSQLARLLSEPTIQRGAFSFFSGRSYATGAFKGREVAIRIQLKRSRYGQGDLVVAVRTGGPAALSSDGIEARVRDETGRRALVSIAANDLLLSVEDGWLKALWRPQGFIIFPGRFSEEKWRQVLEAIHAVAISLATAEGVRA
ncbi:MAG TPA: hypothetical protein VJ813_11025 [Vicinamibacterales bacterium]|nr:hypothetical protein [Vicinamibacterales bacterium]